MLSEPLPPVPAESPPQPGGTLRLALSTAERDALASHGLEVRGRLPPAFVAEGIDQWRRLAPDTLLERVVFVSDRRIPRVELLLLGEIDLVPARGREVARIREAAPQDLRVIRAPGWDRTYVLHCDDDERWTHDPNFRRWFADRIDRTDLVEALFDGFAAPRWSVLSHAAGAVWPPPLHHPFGSTSSPRLDLRFDADDAPAAAIASRLKARFDAERVELSLHADGTTTKRPALRLRGYQRWNEDPVALLQPLAAAAGRSGETAREYLERALAATGEERERLVARAEEALLIDASVVPLVRLETWVAMPASLRGVEPGLSGDLGLERIWWSR